MTAQRRLASVVACGAVLQRLVNPTYVQYRAVAGAQSKQDVKNFYETFVRQEVARLEGEPIEADLLDAMARAKQQYFYTLQSGANVVATLQADLDALIVAVNAADANHAANLRHSAGQVQPGSEAALRLERAVRKGGVTMAGVTKPAKIRGVASQMEATTLLTTLQGALTGALGGGYNLGSVGIRGSAVSGIRSRTGEAFEQGVGPYQNASDASDLDFFFTCPELEAAILKNGEGREQLNAGGTMMAKYLAKWLSLGAGKNKYPGSDNLKAALTAFQDAAKTTTGRKCDVTFIGAPTSNTLATDAGTLIL